MGRLPFSTKGLWKPITGPTRFAQVL